MMCSSVSSTTLRSWRERTPNSYSLKLQNISQVEKSTLFSDGKYQSRLFSSGGYNWYVLRMIIYPKGNRKDDGSGFISMYVEIDSTSLLTTPTTEVFADLRFFVFNKKENKYYTIQHVESKLFNAFRTIWGLAQVLPVDTFTDPKNGYIFEGDQCEFGVDVIVAAPPTNWEIHTLHEALSQPKFFWTVKNFSELNNNVYTSGNFSMRERKCSNTAWGYRKFVSLAEIPKAYLDKDTLKVQIDVEVVSEAEFSPSMI
ncbi:unnamed protein product [Arabidopsis thaliana]|uniref:MATH domain-containing protein n=1 Tax=Arabidopsis thaliana TaxID=3702 RepID=A0A5S9XEN8_ARATH|nr:unnamed protein product [Arabidopsis thaliana]